MGDNLCEFYEKVRKDGIKEVVDWLNKNPIYVYSKKLDNTIPLNTSPEWEHQIKEWGIEDK